MNTVIPPGATIGIVGGGQLGRMLAQAAHQLGYRTAVLTGGAKDTPAGLVSEMEIDAGFENDQAIARFAAEVDVITWEFENVDVGWARTELIGDTPVRPSATAVEVAQDRRLEKTALEDLAVPVAPWLPALDASALRLAIDALGPPVIAKTSRWGYDGKGQQRITSSTEAESAWERLGRQPLVVEAVVEFERELSVVVARGLGGDLADHGVMENVHVDHILDTTVVPAAVDEETETAAREIAARVVGGLDVVGVVCVEMFHTPNGLIVNELAPRPHNSGHCTIEAAAASQFQQQVRAITGLPLGDGSCQPAAMVQLLGDLWAAGEPDWSLVLSGPDLHLHLYGKTEARPGRKMGHVTCVASDTATALEQVEAARRRLRDRVHD